MESESERSSIDDIIAFYARNVDVTLLDANLRLTPAQRVEKFEAFMEDLLAIRGAFADKSGK